MRKYSEANLLLEEEKERGFFGGILREFIKPKTVRLTVKIPTSVHERSLVFCKDIEDEGVEFNEKDLFNLLYHDFLVAVKRNQRLDKWYHVLAEGDRMTRPVQVYHNNREMSPLYPTLLEKQRKKKSLYVFLEVEVEYQPILRGEWFLRDLEQIEHNHPFTIEKVLEILYCDFIYRHQKGEIKNIVQSIVRQFSDEED